MASAGFTICCKLLGDPQDSGALPVSLCHAREPMAIASCMEGASCKRILHTACPQRDWAV